MGRRHAVDDLADQAFLVLLELSKAVGKSIEASDRHQEAVDQLRETIQEREPE